MALLEGIKCNLGGREFVVPPLNIKALRILGPRFAELQTAVAGDDLGVMFQGENLDTLLDVVHAAISRNYPEVTRDELENLVDLGNLTPVFQAVCAQSGMKQGATVGEVKGPKRK